MQHLRIVSRVSIAIALATAPSLSAQTPDLVFAIEWETGNLYRMGNTGDARPFVGDARLRKAASLELGLDGYLYSHTTGPDGEGALHRIDPRDASRTRVGEIGLGFFSFEGGLTLAPGGLAFATSLKTNNDAHLYSIDLANAAASLVGTMGTADMNGLGWREDGVLIGLDRLSQSLVQIDPTDASVTPLATVAPTLGSIGGLSIRGGRGYFVTAGPNADVPGTNELWSFDPWTGASELVGPLAERIQGDGIAGIAIAKAFGAERTSTGWRVRVAATRFAGGHFAVFAPRRSSSRVQSPHLARHGALLHVGTLNELGAGAVELPVASDLDGQWLRVVMVGAPDAAQAAGTRPRDVLTIPLDAATSPSAQVPSPVRARRPGARPAQRVHPATGEPIDAK